MDGYNDFVNYQLWLYETSNVIEMHFGPNENFNVDHKEFYFYFIDADNSPTMGMWGPKAAPEFKRVVSWGVYKGMSNHPDENTVYTFTPGLPTAVSQLTNPEYANWLSQSNNGFVVQLPRSVSVQVTSLDGRVLDVYSTDGYLQADTDHLSEGIYLVSALGEGINLNGRIWVH
jgi:hypothetical protein